MRKDNKKSENREPWNVKLHTLKRVFMMDS